MFKWDEFRIGFWHPFGSYAGLSADRILNWKRDEAKRHGWTFWSFAWCEMGAWSEILRNAVGPVYALCSHSPNATDPDPSKKTEFATSYQWNGDDAWISMPPKEEMYVTNPFKHRNMAVAFKVKQVIDFATIQRPQISVEWYKKSADEWQNGPLPTKGQYLIRVGSGQRLRPIRAVLELAPPYLARLRSSDAM